MEMMVAKAYCHGLTDKEVSLKLAKPIWTIRTHKYHIYRKLHISTMQELVMFMVARLLKVKWDVCKLRSSGLLLLDTHNDTVAD